jgi:hypothetical protein
MRRNIVASESAINKSAVCDAARGADLPNVDSSEIQGIIFHGLSLIDEFRGHVYGQVHLPVGLVPKQHVRLTLFPLSLFFHGIRPHISSGLRPARRSG